MCGIAGFCNFNKYDKQRNIEAMLLRMIHRGPDSGGVYHSDDGDVTLGHRRLSIIDVSSNGGQPMTSHNGRYVMVYNGEIYNHLELKEKLVSDPSLGISKSDFKGTSDSEILLEAISSYGIEDTLAFCKGMFAIAVYDRQDKSLTLARDRIGEKPLYYGRVGSSFVFSSDIGSIRVLEGFDNRINTSVLDMYFIHGYIAAPYTIYEGIHKLEPGCILKLDKPYDMDKAVITRYYDIREVALKGMRDPFKGTLSEAADRLDGLLRDSIRGQMLSDVPLGAFLSAGIDSSTVVSLMQQISSGKVRSFTIGMEDPKYNEAGYAKQIAQHLGTEHTELYITEDDAKSVIPKIARMFGEPFADSSQIPTYCVSKMTREHVTVSLSGDGGDELFCGYGSYKSVSRAWNKMRRIPYPIRKVVSSIALKTPLKNDHDMCVRSTILGAKGPKDLYNLSKEFDPQILAISLDKNRALNNNDTINPGFLGEPNKDIMLMDMMMYHPDDILVKVDRCAMAVSLETRVPMLDRDVVEFAWTLPIEHLYDPATGTGKKVLREVLYRYVPREIMERPKTGFAIPIEKWLVEDKGLNEWARTLIDHNRIASEGFLDPDTVDSIWNDFTDNGVWRPQIWFILMFQSWLEGEALAG